MRFALVLLASYLLGSIPFSHLFPKAIKGHDVRQKGTKNVGATNALVVGGKRAGLLALIGDLAKGYLAIALARYFGLSDWGIALVALAVIAGHDFSVFLRFKGGKGVATTGGVLLALDPLLTILIILLWSLCLLVLRYFIPSTVLVLCFVPVMMWLASWRLEYILIFGLPNALLAVYTHRENLKLFFEGKELTISESIEKHFKK